MLGMSFTLPKYDWITDRYGSYRGLLFTWWHRLRYLLGSYRRYRRIEWGSVERLVFVCKGNICRSAYAEAVALKQGLEAKSCGIDTRPGVEADDGAIRAAMLRGIDLNSHRTTPIQSLSLGTGDLLVVMEPSQAEQLMQVAGRAYQCTLLGIWGGVSTPYIRDPFGASAGYFDNCFKYIERSVHGIVSKISASKGD